MTLYKHVNNTDVAVEVLKRFYIKEKDAYSLKVAWWNIGPHEPYALGITQRLTIPREKWLREWKLYDTAYNSGRKGENLYHLWTDASHDVLDEESSKPSA